MINSDNNNFEFLFRILKVQTKLLLSIQETIGEVRRATEDLLLLFKRVSLDEDLEDSFRGEMMTMMTTGASDNMDVLRLVQDQDKRSQSEIAEAAMESIRNFQKSLTGKHNNDIPT